MGWTVLYIAFGVVALWLLGEVLLQYKARLQWRLLAFGGFLGVVLGVLIPSVVVIAIGAIAFATGQTYVTLSFRRGYATGWAIGGRADADSGAAEAGATEAGAAPSASRRRKAGAKKAGREPALEVSALEENAPAYDPVPAYDNAPAYDTAAFPAMDPQARETDADPVYAPLPMPDDTAGYGVYSDTAYDALHQGQHPGPDHDRERVQAEGDPNHVAYDGPYDPYYGDRQPAGQDGAYDYNDGQQYAAYSDPYVGGHGQQYEPYGGYDNTTDRDGHDSFGNQQQYNPDPYYAQQPYTDTPPGGVWVPQQRDDERPPDPAAEQPPYGYDTGYNEQQHYRY
ncbi:hypothetical protein [Streptomyces sp. NPDC020965]|uniref:hypothetical protein n=1 Tax=Streptomyces sp. NPDC020965 TaxID=3365105 RepID=UPI00379EB770